MNLENMTLADISKLVSILGGKSSESKSPDQGDQGTIKIVILQRGWVAVGKYYREGDDCRLENASIIRNWGTTKGLGEIALDGPTSKTILDSCPTIRFHVLTAVASIDCVESKWKLK